MHPLIGPFGKIQKADNDWLCCCIFLSFYVIVATFITIIIIITGTTTIAGLCHIRCNRRMSKIHNSLQ
jgi:hypothetical protein